MKCLTWTPGKALATRKIPQESVNLVALKITETIWLLTAKGLQGHCCWQSMVTRTTLLLAVNGYQDNIVAGSEGYWDNIVAGSKWLPGQHYCWQ